MANTKKRVLSLLMALVMMLGLLPTTAFAGELHAVGDSFRAEEKTAVLPENIPENTYWAGPTETPAARGTLICTLQEHTHVTAAACTHTHVDACYPTVWVACTRENNFDHYNKHGHKLGQGDYDWDREEYGTYQTSQDPDACPHVCSAAEGCVTEEMLCANPCPTEKHTHNADLTSEKCCYEVIPAFYTWTLSAYQVDSVSIQDTIATDGSLHAVVNGRATTYQWYKNNQLLDGETGDTLFVAKAESADTTLPTYQVVASVGTSSKRASYTIPYYTALQNGSFEKPKVTSGGPSQVGTFDGMINQFPNGTDSLIWTTTATDQRIELVNPAVSSKYNNFPQNGHDGKQFAELNAQAYGALYQDIMTEPGSTLHWSFLHSGRGGAANTMQLVIGNAGGFGENWNPAGTTVPVGDGSQGVFTSAGNTWTYYHGDYVVPVNSYITRFYFNSTRATGSADGNLLDKITFSTTRPEPPVDMLDYTIIYQVDGVERSRETGSIAANRNAYPSQLESYQDYDADSKNAAYLTVTEAGPNVLTLHFTTPGYTVQYFIRTGTAAYAETTAPSGASTSGKAAYGAAVTGAGLTLPDKLTVDAVTYGKTGVDSFTMTKGGANVLKVYYDYVPPVEYPVTYAWTTDSASRPANVTLPGNGVATENVAFTAAALPTTAAEGYAISETWYTDAAGTIAYVPTVLTKATTLYARCTYTEPSKYNVTYGWVSKTDNEIPAGVTLPVNQQNITLSALKQIAITPLTTSLDGYTFAGWYTDAAATSKFTDTTLENQTGSVQLFAYFTYKTPVRTYHVNYEFYYKENGGTYAKQGTVPAVSNGQISQANATLQTVYAAQKATLTNNQYPYSDRAYTIGVYDADPAKSAISATGTWETGLTYTIRFYASDWTVGSLYVSKTFTGAAATQAPDFKVEVTDAEGTAVGSFTYAQLPATVSNLQPGTYTVTELNAQIPGYTLTPVSDVDLDSAKAGYQVDVTAGETPASIALTNIYTSKEYTVIFDAASYGQIKGNTVVNGIYTNRWSEFTPSEGEPYYGWAGTLNANAPGSRLVYTFSYGDYLKYTGDMTIAQPDLLVAPGYLSDKNFYHGQDGYQNIAAAISAMNAAEVTSITYAAEYARSEETPYTVHYFYQQPNGQYDEAHPTDSAARKGTTGELAALTAADLAAVTDKGMTYVLDKTVDHVRIAGDGSAVLKVYFKWQKTAAYQYEGGTPAILAAHPLPADATQYGAGAAVTNLGTAITDRATDPTGAWSLTWNKTTDTMTADGVTFLGTWTYTPNGSGTVTLRFVDESGNELRQSMTKTAPSGTAYDFSAATTVETLEKDGFTYEFLSDDGAAYTGSVTERTVTFTRVYAVRTAGVMLSKEVKGTDTLPANFTITVADKITNAAVAALTLEGAERIEDGRWSWFFLLPVGREYRFTESGYNLGEGWSTVLTARQNVQIANNETEWQACTVTTDAFSVLVGGNTLISSDRLAMIEMTNTYRYTAPILPPVIDDDDDDGDDGYPDTPPVVIPDDPTPTTDLPEEEVTDLPDGEVPLAEVPATGDDLTMWILAAAVSGLGLVWLVISRKHGEENAK